jgi:glycerophosphoryl diester phosphodiesterase
MPSETQVSSDRNDRRAATLTGAVAIDQRSAGYTMATLREMLTGEGANGRRVLVVGHRGAMGHCPENTMVSFQRATEMGADLIELDVHLTRDGHLAVIHDETLERSTNGKGLVQSHTMAELKALDAGSWYGSAFAGQQIPTLDEVLAWASQRGVAVDIEIKNAPIYYEGIEQAVVEALDRAQMSERSIVISFDHPVVRRLKEIDSRVATGVLYAGRPVDPVEMARSAHADALLPHWAYVTPDDVQRAHANGIGVAPWVSSDPRVLTQLIAAGVDGVGTNHPDVLRKIVDERQGAANQASGSSPR